MNISRRNFLGGLSAGVALAATPGCATPACTGSRQLPDWANAQIDEAVARFKVWKGGEKTISFTFFTDPHSHLEELPNEPDFSDSRFHTLFTQAVADRAGCDFLVDGGDHDYDFNGMTPEEGHPSDEGVTKRIAVTRSFYADYSAKPVLFCMGNHDHGPARPGGLKARPVSSSRFGNVFNGIAEEHGFKLVFGENRSWGWYDIPGKNFRAVFCNTSDEGYYGLSESQLGFIQKALDTLPEGWTCALFGHWCIFQEIGHWKSYEPDGMAKSEAAFRAMLEAFAKKRPNDLAGYFCGDSHFDNELEWHGVNWTISQGYGGVGRFDKPWGARRVEFDHGKAMLFELVAVKPSVGEFKVFRVGAGGASCDRLCVYHNKFDNAR